ncbi:hypothetical protein [Bacillus sp. AFS018417]|uniref:hypothetical protein n=1 Tax=Bacillus sp. AFS018417 TaxID=2033491 RepID=UPI0020D1FF03|nr:hypothetical protein [Bacillus sp. AFS018417]
MINFNGEEVTKVDSKTKVVQSNIKAWFAIGASSITLFAIILKSFLPEAPDYTMGFAPVGITVFASILGMIALALSINWQRESLTPRFLLLISTWGACFMLVWSSGGIVFDILRTAAVLGIPGLPPVVDWPGFATRTISLIAAILLAAATLSFQRISRGACTVCGQGPSVKTQPDRIWFGYAAFVLSFPYPLLKLYWSFGGTLGGGQNFSQHSAYGEMLVFGACALLCLALVQKWGRIFPKWVPFVAGKKVPRFILITGGWVAASMTVSMGFLAILGSLLEVLGLSNGPMSFDDEGLLVSIVYGGWLLLGIAITGATWNYQKQTRGKCVKCGKF